MFEMNEGEGVVMVLLYLWLQNRLAEGIVEEFLPSWADLLKSAVDQKIRPPFRCVLSPEFVESAVSLICRKRIRRHRAVVVVVVVATEVG